MSRAGIDHAAQDEENVGSKTISFPLSLSKEVADVENTLMRYRLPSIQLLFFGSYSRSHASITGSVNL